MYTATHCRGPARPTATTQKRKNLSEIQKEHHKTHKKEPCLFFAKKTQQFADGTYGSVMSEKCPYSAWTLL